MKQQNIHTANRVSRQKCDKEMTKIITLRLVSVIYVEGPFNL